MTTLPPPRVRELTRSFERKVVVVVGDVMLDEYVRGEVTRISPEAPVPVVDFQERTLRPGGAANAAANVVSLGGVATLLGVVGEDATADALASALSEKGIVVNELVRTASRPTTHKLRIVARAQQIARVDVESRSPLSSDAEARLIASIERLAATAQALVISDYDKGVVTPKVAAAVARAAKAHGIVSVADPKGRDFRKYSGVTYITPNVTELEIATGRLTDNEDERVIEAGNALLAMLDGGTSVLVTRGARGMTLLRRGELPVHVPTVARTVFDVTGAGDTVVGALTLALASGVGIEEAMILASHAARIAVSRAGTIAVTHAELIESFEP